MAEPKFDITLDVIAPKNRNVRFWPAGIIMRGEASVANVNYTLPALQAIGGKIPGHRMLVDTKQRKVRLIDRMTLPENKHIDQALRSLTRTERYLTLAYDRYEAAQDFDVALADWPTWLYWIKRLVDHERMKVVDGKLPCREGLAGYADIVRLGPVNKGESMGLKALDPKKPEWILDASDAHLFEGEPQTAMAGAKN